MLIWYFTHVYRVNIRINIFRDESSCVLYYVNFVELIRMGCLTSLCIRETVLQVYMKEKKMEKCNFFDRDERTRKTRVRMTQDIGRMTAYFRLFSLSAFFSHV